jgi:RNA polymerase sigma-70 factor (ECF subfamily)
VSAAPRLSKVPDDDATLVARAVAGDERAFTAIYRRHARYVAGVAFRLMGDEAELDDVVQETFVAASSALASLEDRGALRSWLVTIAVRAVSKRIARRQRGRWLSSLLGRTQPRSTPPAVEGDAYALYEALEALSADLRVPWALHAIEGMTLPDVAARCGVSLATVKRRIKEAGELLEKRGVRTGGDDGR